MAMTAPAPAIMGAQVQATITLPQMHLLAHLLTLEGSPEEEMSRTLAGARVDMNPHQVEAALFALRSPLSKGVMLADEVGLGKTIEASLVIAQRWAERRRRVILVVPATLRKQWAQELHDKFGLPSVVLEAKAYNAERRDGVANPFDRIRPMSDPEIVICSYQFAASKKADLAAVPWDLVVFDEAHKLRNVWRRAGATTAQALKEATEGRQKLLLSATPLQNSLIELYGLATFIDDHVFGPEASFRANYMIGKTGAQNLPLLRERLGQICARTLRRQVQAEGGISFTRRLSITEDFTPTDEEQELYDRVSEYLQRDDIRAFDPKGRHLVTLVLRKLLASSPTAIEGALQKVVSRLKAKQRAGGDDLEDFETADELAEELDQDEADTDEQMSFAAELEELRAARTLAAGIRQNTKADALLRVLGRAMDEVERLGGQRKAVIFTESVRTQTFLRDLLTANGYAGRIVLMNGSNTDPESHARYKQWVQRHHGTAAVSGSRTADTKAAIVEAFREDADILIATEAGGEGVNLQFCSLLVNFDLPWNPQRVEQRIGRIHRYGQKCDVVVVNFINRANRADERVFELLQEKFALFDGVFGASDEILGALESGVDIERRIFDIYQQCRTTDEVEEAFDALQAEMDALLSEKDTETRAKLIEHFDETVAERLKGRREATTFQLDQFQRRLLALARGAGAQTDGHRLVHDGQPYTLDWREAEEEPATFFHLGLPVVDAMVEAAKGQEPGPVRVAFELDAYDGYLADAERLRESSGTLVAGILSMRSLKDREELVLVMQGEGGKILAPETASRLLMVPATVAALSPAFDPEAMDDAVQQALADRKARAAREDEAFFGEEQAKLDAWAEEAKAAGRLEIDAMAREIKRLKSEARRAGALEDKLAPQREAKALEKQRRDRQMSLYDEEERIEEEQDVLLDRVQAMLDMGTTWRPLVALEWAVV
ncbi:SNF2-related protein [uncultured Jannaschia sp.]|uniref:SNF2-related protein n=1 Tax=uncultured Jannaschia sp. TaxID=293347 RepID=UPI002618E38E|nr:SNF2-related protein [uncultured Jannaschia sp.]